VECRSGCGACCIALSISTPMPGYPAGKPAGERCLHLDAALRCSLYGQPQRPAACDRLRPAPDICGEDREQALQLLHWLEQATMPGSSPESSP